MTFELVFHLCSCHQDMFKILTLFKKMINTCLLAYQYKWHRVKHSLSTPHPRHPSQHILCLQVFLPLAKCMFTVSLHSSSFSILFILLHVSVDTCTHSCLFFLFLDSLLQCIIGFSHFHPLLSSIFPHSPIEPLLPNKFPSNLYVSFVCVTHCI